MKTPAQKVQSKIKNYCDRHNVMYNKTVVMSNIGWPDIQILCGSITYYFEVKVKGDTVSPIQEYNHKMMNRTKRICFVVENCEEFIDIFEKLTESYRNIIKELDTIM